MNLIARTKFIELVTILRIQTCTKEKMQLKGLFGTNDCKMKDEGEKYMNGEEWKSKNHRIANTQEWKFDLIGSHEINSMVACSLSNKSTFIMFFQLIFVIPRMICVVIICHLEYYWFTIVSTRPWICISRGGPPVPENRFVGTGNVPAFANCHF